MYNFPSTFNVQTWRATKRERNPEKNIEIKIKITNWEPDSETIPKVTLPTPLFPPYSISILQNLFEVQLPRGWSSVGW